VSEYQIKTVLLRSGERLPMLLDSNGIPAFAPTVFAVAEIRNRHRASNTMMNALAALSILQSFLDRHGLDLNQRLSQGKLLELGEIEELATACRQDRTRGGRKLDVAPDVCGNRIRTIRRYLEWLAKGRLLSSNYPHAAQLQLVSDLTITTLNARVPPARQQLDPREGLAPEDARRAAEVFDAQSEVNAWKQNHTRIRNHLIWSLLYNLGIRAGELLGIRIRHINLRKGTICILRQADAYDDPRRRQPNTKTLARELEISEVLQRQLSEYILVHRRRIAGARKHDFLFVSSSGVPLSSTGFSKIFRVLRKKHPELPRKLTSHVLRHTWNDRFSEELEDAKVDPEIEKKMRSFQMGWKPTSNSAAVYTRRYVRKKAQEVSVELQKKSMNRSKK
jgi:integrase